jgi:hypothetical protein
MGLPFLVPFPNPFPALQLCSCRGSQCRCQTVGAVLSPPPRTLLYLLSTVPTITVFLGLLALPPLMCRWCSSTAASQHVSPSIQEMFGASSFLDVILLRQYPYEGTIFCGATWTDIGKPCWPSRTDVHNMSLTAESDVCNLFEGTDALQIPRVKWLLLFKVFLTHTPLEMATSALTSQLHREHASDGAMLYDAAGPDMWGICRANGTDICKRVEGSDTLQATCTSWHS